MYIREVKKQRSKHSKIFYQYSLTQTVRIDGKVKQRSILYLGSETLLKDKKDRMVILGILKSKIFKQPDLFPSNAPQRLRELANHYYEKFCIKYNQEEKAQANFSIPPLPDKAEYQEIDIKGMDVIDIKEFGNERLCMQIMEKLELKELFKQVGMPDSQIRKALISIAARAIYSASEHKTARILETNSELAHLYGYDEKITHKQLYAISDLLYNNKTEIDKYLYNRITDIFSLEDRLVIFDVSNTYFETRKGQSGLAKYGRSKEKRNDCPLVVFTGVINAEGFIRHSRIYEGNKADEATLTDMIKDLERYSKANEKHTIVLDAGIATDDNLAELSSKGYKYVCVSRTRIKDYPADDESNVKIQLTNRDKSQVALSIFQPPGYNDRWMYVQSDEKRKKEQSINVKLRQRFEEELESIKKSFSKKGGTKKINKVWERIGRVKQKHIHVSGRYELTVREDAGIATDLQWIIKTNKIKDDKSKGVYFIRTNYRTTSEEELWKIYNIIREVESTFRCLKTDLNIRPVHHQKDNRVEAHLYLTLLSYQVVNAIRFMLKNAGINYDWKNIKRIMSTQKIQTVKLPTEKKIIYIRKPSVPITEVKQIYDAAGCSNTQSVFKKYVVYH
ncbi:MAG: IS1634 family transposase [Deltaproteobacteria bacterium]|nr:IS1634 family transposase [Deltaproteobacteria bacterium]